MYSITEEKNLLKIVISKKCGRFIGLGFIVFCLLFGDGLTHYQLKCETKAPSYAGQCALVSKVLDIIPLSTPLGRIVEANVGPTSRSGRFTDYYQVFLHLDSDRSYYLPLFFQDHENAAMVASYVNQYISDETRTTYDISDLEYNPITLALTLLLLVFGFCLLFVRNGVILFDKNSNSALIQHSSLIPNTKKYLLSDINKAIVQEKITTPELTKRYLLVLELKNNDVLLLTDTVNEVESEVVSLCEHVNKLLQVD